MDTSRIVLEIDKEIERLKAAKKLLTGGSTRTTTTGRKPRKPMSKAARARISAAQKKRWATQRKAA
jgi:hypothetical protein